MFNGMNGLEILKNWPRFEDGDPVRVGDSAPFGTDDVMEVVGVEINRFGYVLHGSINDGMRECVDGDEHGVAVNRPAPKVLDADGEEIRVGDTVYSTCDTESGTVVYAYPPGDGGQPSVKVGAFWYHASELTHRAPVLAADGKPLREGETVWYLDHIDPLEVRSVSTTSSCGSYVKAYNDYEGEVSAPARCFSHERPDSWERLEDDATIDPRAYCSKHRLYIDPYDGDSAPATEKFARDLVRRAKALAERDR